MFLKDFLGFLNISLRFAVFFRELQKNPRICTPEPGIFYIIFKKGRVLKT